MIEWIGLATGVDLHRGLRDGNLGIDIGWQSATVSGTGEEKWGASGLGFVAVAVVAVVGRWEEFGGRYLRVAGLVASWREVLGQLEVQTGKRFEVGRVEREEGVREAERRIKGGWPDAGMFLLERSVLADERCLDGVCYW